MKERENKSSTEESIQHLSSSERNVFDSDDTFPEVKFPKADPILLSRTSRCTVATQQEIVFSTITGQNTSSSNSRDGEKSEESSDEEIYETTLIQGKPSRHPKGPNEFLQTIPHKLQKHELSHPDFKEYSCSHCDYASSWQGYIKHIMMHIRGENRHLARTYRSPSWRNDNVDLESISSSPKGRNSQTKKVFSNCTSTGVFFFRFTLPIFTSVIDKDDVQFHTRWSSPTEITDSDGNVLVEIAASSAPLTGNVFLYNENNSWSYGDWNPNPSHRMLRVRVEHNQNSNCSVGRSRMPNGSNCFAQRRPVCLHIASRLSWLEEGGTFGNDGSYTCPHCKHCKELWISISHALVMRFFDFEIIRVSDYRLKCSYSGFLKSRWIPWSTIWRNAYIHSVFKFMCRVWGERQLNPIVTISKIINIQIKKCNSSPEDNCLGAMLGQQV